ncbi:GNAT family N-acetyltransferase [Deinococcus sp. Marseille-Q6407]|uniref:GNAT family N-acetyltransferase n=1 Tax=Deinococcus sp. Marseille-Q6407 TaxID=2969223 RepID=UPI0021C01194|nr:GNAT family N-acetyltransferase [Deinococcus sp. Marseille-Q6407]
MISSSLPDAPPPEITVRRITDPNDPALDAFAQVQQSSYYAPDTLIPPQMFPELVAGRGAGRLDRLLVVQNAGGEVLGGTLYHLLPGAGFNSFMGVAAPARGLGVGRALHRASLADAAAHGRAGMFADSVYAARQSPAERAAEQRTGTDAQQRRQALHALGLRAVDLAYWQPVGGPDGGPIQDLDLLYAPPDPQQSTVALALVLEVLGAYWHGWLGEKRTAAELAGLRARAGGDELALLPATQTPGYWS